MAFLTPAPADGGSLAEACPRERTRDHLTDLGARLVVGGLFAILAVRIAREFFETGHLTGLLLLASELLVVVFTIIRRPAIAVDRTIGARIVTAVSLLGVPLIRPTGGSLFPDGGTAALSALGLLVIVVGKATLGRSFGLMPANRGVVSTGIYQLVRHPIYAGYLVTHVAFLMAHPSGWNLAVLGVSDLALLIRSVYEERTLARDAEYAAYMARVRWRVAPGVF